LTALVVVWPASIPALLTASPAALAVFACDLPFRERLGRALVRFERGCAACFGFRAPFALAALLELDRFAFLAFVWAILLTSSLKTAWNYASAQAARPERSHRAAGVPTSALSPNQLLL
jgi:hypothetical protein